MGFTGDGDGDDDGGGAAPEVTGSVDARVVAVGADNTVTVRPAVAKALCSEVALGRLVARAVRAV